MAADSAARRLQLNTEAGTTQSSVQKQQDPTKDLADEIRALLNRGISQQTELLKNLGDPRHRSDSPRQIEGTWQYIRRHLAADSAARRLQLNTEAGTTQSSVQKQQDPTKDLADEIRALLKQRCSSNSPRQIEGTRQYIRRHLAADTEVTPSNRLKVLGSTLGFIRQQTEK